jgi:hypothetical protein
VLIAIPVKNEMGRIAKCLQALAFQHQAPPYQIVLLLNNCTDMTGAVVNALAQRLPVPIHSVEINLPHKLANAGYARHLAMEAAAQLVAPNGILLTTDADSQVDPNWIAYNLRALRRGADAVAGRIDIDPVEAALIPLRLHEDDARECLYGALLDKINATFDPDVFDPLPRHNEHSGASIAVTLSAYRRVGGIPPIPLGEDRAFFAALRRIDARIRHAPEVRVTVSARTSGRATGGMADTIRRRMEKPDEMLDENLEPAVNAARRSELRSLARAVWLNRHHSRQGIGALASHLGFSSAELQSLLSLPYFGNAWAAIEERSSELKRLRVPVSDLDYETSKAGSILRLFGIRESTISSSSEGQLNAP